MLPCRLAKCFILLSYLVLTSAWAEKAPTQVEVLQVGAQNVPIKIELPTVLMGSEEVELRARVPGRIEKIHFDDGMFVDEGDLLYSLDAKPLEAALASAQSDQAALKARLDQANRNLKRVNALKNQRAIAQKDVDDAVSAQAIAAADLLAGKARVQQAQLNVAYAQIQAPISGLMSRSLVSTGDYVAGAEDVLAHLTQTRPMHARFSLPTRVYAGIQAQARAGEIMLPGTDQWKARLKFGFDMMHEEVGSVDFIDQRVNPLTGSQEGRATFPNDDGVLLAGQYLRIYVEGAYRPNAIAIPQGAVLDSAKGKYVYRYAKHKRGYAAQPQPVELGEWVVLQGKNYWVVRKGLVPNDQIIISGHAKIFAPMTPVFAAGPLQVQGKEGEVLSEQSI